MNISKNVARLFTSGFFVLLSVWEGGAQAEGFKPEMVNIPGKHYEIGKFEVSQGEWRAVMGRSPSWFKHCGDSCPVEQVSWEDIQTFLQRLNARTNMRYRLPFEAEWEFACYGGRKTKFCGGDKLDELGWHGNNGEPGGNSAQTTHPSGQKQANGYGLYDMSGNVFEWMNDCWKGDCAKHVIRGGSWSNLAKNARTNYRHWYGSASRLSLGGFRLARTVR